VANGHRVQHTFDLRVPKSLEDAGTLTVACEYNSCVAVLVVYLRSAANLPDLDYSMANPEDHSDPFALLSLGNRSHESQVVYDDLNPEWNERFMFLVESPADVLDIKVIDFDGDSLIGGSINPDDELGVASIPLLETFNGTAGRQVIEATWALYSSRNQADEQVPSITMKLELYCNPEYAPMQENIEAKNRKQSTVRHPGALNKERPSSSMASLHSDDDARSMASSSLSPEGNRTYQDPANVRPKKGAPSPMIGGYGWRPTTVHDNPLVADEESPRGRTSSVTRRRNQGGLGRRKSWADITLEAR